MLLILTLISIGGVLLGFKPVFILMLSQACIAVVLPITIASIFYLTSKNELMKGFKNKAIDNIILTLILGFAFYMSSLGIQGLISDLSGLYT